MSDGSITVIDLGKGDVIGSVNTLKDQGFNPNSIVLLPQWNHPGMDRAPFRSDNQPTRACPLEARV